MLNQLYRTIVRLKIWTDQHGQDMVEYALLAGFITVTVGAGYPPVSNDISEIFSKLGSITDEAP
jgi:Flp pilus assembly pilin Flp